MTATASADAGRPIRLTYVITDLQVGGVPLHLYRLATRLPRERFHVQVISLADEGPVGAMLRKEGIPVLACGAKSPWDLRALGRLWRFLRARRPHILHALLFHANMAARIVGPLAGIPASRIICEIQTVERERRWHLIVDNLTCRLCRCEVGNSPSVVDHLARRAHVPKARLRCEWGAVDLEAITLAEPIPRSELGLPADVPMVIWTGRLDPVKGFEEMLAALSQVCRKRSVRLVLVGEGPYRPAIEKLIREHGLSANVMLLGQRFDVPSLLKASDLFLFCSRTEGLPNALLEAMAAELPIIATDAPGCRDLIVHDKSGLLVSTGSVDAIARGIETLCDDPARRRRFGQAAHAWARANADVRLWTKRWARVYDSIVSAHV